MSETSPDKARQSRQGDPSVVRALALLVEMARSKRGVLLQPFAEQRGYPLRNVYRARDALIKAGAPIRASASHRGRWQLEDGWLPASVVGPARLELLALFVARSLAPGLRGTTVGRALDTLWSKLASFQPQQSFELEPGALTVRTFAPIDYAAHAATIDTLRDAIEQRHAVWIRYRTPSRTVTDRVIEPGVLHWDGGLEAMYVPSWCRLRDAVRVFAVHRILAVEAKADTPSRSIPARCALDRAFRVWYRDQLEHVTLWFSSRLAGEIRERVWHPSQRIESRPDGSIIMHFDVSAPQELERWLLGFGADVRVMAPDELATRVVEAHTRAIAGSSVVRAALRPTPRVPTIRRGAERKS